MKATLYFGLCSFLNSDIIFECQRKEDVAKCGDTKIPLSIT